MRFMNIIVIIREEIRYGNWFFSVIVLSLFDMLNMKDCVWLCVYILRGDMKICSVVLLIN